MADLLTHVLVPFILLTPASWRLPWLERRWIVIGMAGAAIPDLVKIGIALDDDAIEAILDVPFSYAPISSLGGLVIIAGGIAILFTGRVRRAYRYLLFGGLASLVIDGLRVFADGRADFWLYPIWWRPPTPSLYVTSNPRVTALALALASVVLVADRYRARQVSAVE